MIDSLSLVESLQYFSKLFLLSISEFLILDELLKLLNEKFLDLEGMLIFSEKVEEKVDIKSAFSFVGEGLEHGQNGVMCGLLIYSGEFFHEPNKLWSDGVVGILVALV